MGGLAVLSRREKVTEGYPRWWGPSQERVAAKGAAVLRAAEEALQPVFPAGDAALLVECWVRFPRYCLANPKETLVGKAGSGALAEAAGGVFSWLEAGAWEAVQRLRSAYPMGDPVLAAAGKNVPPLVPPCFL